jgi:hypothetical protein
MLSVMSLLLVRLESAWSIEAKATRKEEDVNLLGFQGE